MSSERRRWTELREGTNGRITASYGFAAGQLVTRMTVICNTYLQNTHICQTIPSCGGVVEEVRDFISMFDPPTLRFEKSVHTSSYQFLHLGKDNIENGFRSCLLSRGHNQARRSWPVIG